MLVSLYLSILYGILYGFFETFSVVFVEIRGFETTSYGLTYIALGLGFAVGSILLGTLGRKSCTVISYMTRADRLNFDRVDVREERQRRCCQRHPYTARGATQLGLLRGHYLANVRNSIPYLEY